MLDKRSAAANIALIIKNVKGCLLTREFFENALYDVFDSTGDIEDIMEGYEYFSLLIKKPRVETAVAHLAKNLNLPKEKIREICEIWSEAKFAGKTEEDIAATVYAVTAVQSKTQPDVFTNASPEDFSEVEFIATDTKARKGAKKPPKKVSEYGGKTSQAAGSAPRSAPMQPSKSASKSVTRSKSLTRRSLTKADIPQGLQDEQYRKVNSTKLYRILSGKNTTVENYYSTPQKVLFAIFSVLGMLLSVALGFLLYGEEFFWVNAMIIALVYGAAYLVAFVFLHRGMKVTAPIKWTSLLFAPVFLAAMGYFKLCMLFAPLVFFELSAIGGGLLFAFPFMCAVFNWFFMRKHQTPSKRFVYAACTCVYQMVLSFGYISLSGLISYLSFDVRYSLLALYGLYMLLYIPVMFVFTRMYSRHDVFFSCVLMLMLPLVQSLLRFIGYAGTYIMGIKIEWYITTVAELILLTVGVLSYFNYLKTRYVKGLAVFVFIYVLSSLLYGAFALMFSKILPALPSAEWVWMVAAVSITSLLLLLIKLLIIKKIIPAIRNAKKQKELLRQAEEKARLAQIQRQVDKKYAGKKR